MKMFNAVMGAFMVVSCGLAREQKSENFSLQHAVSKKFPGAGDLGTQPILSSALSPVINDATEELHLGGFDELVPFALASPDQEDAGTCLYMASTGVAEWWLNRLHPTWSRTGNGPTDLSERYLMNMAGSDTVDSIKKWQTDTVLAFNDLGKAVLNKAYPYTKNWWRYDDDEKIYKKAKKTDPNAEFGTEYNWVNESKAIKNPDTFVTMPTFSREVLFAEPRGNVWSVGVMPQDIHETVKQALTTSKSPVIVIYNHFGYWHAVSVLGFNDRIDNENCKFVRDTRDYFKTLADKNGPQSHAAKHLKSLDRAWKEGGGCSGTGAFFVRDSIYASPSEPPYVYNDKSDEPGSKGHYSKKIVFLEYEWLRYLGNHAVVVRAQ